jgi:hypothetical protein
MRFLLALALSLCVALPVRAQTVPGGPSTPLAPPTEAMLRRLAGDDVELVRRSDGTVRALIGARIAGTGAPGPRAVALLERFAPVFGLPSGARFEVVRELDAHGLHVVRLAQRVAGLRVLGTQAVVRMLPDGAIEHVAVSPPPSELALGSARIADAAAAEAAVLSALPPGFRALGAEPFLFGLDDALVPVWAVSAATPIETSLELVLLDARSGEVLVRIPRLLDARGNVFERNPRSDMNVTAEVELTDLTGTGLIGRYVRVASCDARAGTGCAGTSYAEPDAMGDFLYSPQTGRAYDDAFAEVNVYHHINRVAGYFRTAHDFTWTCGASTTLPVLVNYTEAPSTPYDNAAYSPGGSSCGLLLFGEGTSGDFAYDADVAYHEYGHAVTDALTDILGFSNNTLGVSYLPLAINEGTSDYWAATLQGDPNVAESFSSGSVLGSTGSLRVIENDLRCPNDLIGEGHFDGRIHAAVAWDLRVALGAEEADRILFASVTTYLSDVDLSAAASAMRATAVTLAGMGMVDPSAPALLDGIIDARGLVDCERIVPLDDGMNRQGYSGTESITGSIGRRIAPNHYRIDVPADATELRLFIGRFTVSGSYTLHVRPEVPVRVASRIVSSYSAPIGNRGELVLSSSSDFVLPRCATLYVAVQVDDLTTAGQSLYNISASMTRSGDPAATCPTPPDAGTGAADAGASASDAGAPAASSGCGCRAGRAGPPGLPLAALAAWLLGRRLRR